MSAVDLRFNLDAQTRIVRPESPNGSCDCAWADGLSFYAILSDASLRELFHMVIEKVRHERTPIRLTLRCDKPDLRREAYVILSPAAPQGSQELEVENGTLSATPRDPVLLLDPAIPRDRDFITICSWCKRVKVGDDEWVEVEEAIARLGLFDRIRLPRLTHGMCPDCSRDLRAAIAARKAAHTR